MPNVVNMETGYIGFIKDEIFVSTSISLFSFLNFYFIKELSTSHATLSVLISNCLCDIKTLSKINGHRYIPKTT